MIATVIVGILFFQLILRYRPRRKMISRVMQMFFAYEFLLCNMSLLTDYTEVIKTDVAYDLGINVQRHAERHCTDRIWI